MNAINWSLQGKLDAAGRPCRWPSDFSFDSEAEEWKAVTDYHNGYLSYIGDDEYPDFD